jgi:hypothetical protein
VSGVLAAVAVYLVSDMFIKRLPAGMEQAF